MVARQTVGYQIHFSSIPSFFLGSSGASHPLYAHFIRPLSQSNITSSTTINIPPHFHPFSLLFILFTPFLIYTNISLYFISLIYLFIITFATFFNTSLPFAPLTCNTLLRLNHQLVTSLNSFLRLV